MNNIEQELRDKGLDAPRLTPDMIEAIIKHEQYHVFDGSMLTVCNLTLMNGFNVVGESACASPENFNEQIGRKVARADAVKKIWAFEGYRLKEKLLPHETDDMLVLRLKAADKYNDLPAGTKALLERDDLS